LHSEENNRMTQETSKDSRASQRPDRFRYRGNRTKAISFPLGGIGTGSVGLSGTGRLVDWEIFNRPNKNSFNGFSFFALRALQDGELRTASVLHGDLDTEFTGHGDTVFRGFGFGVNRETVSGFPHFPKSEFRGKFPIAEMTFEDEDNMLSVELVAFNPFIPMNDRDSSLPVASFEYRVTNKTRSTMDCTLAGVLTNPSLRNPRNRFVDGNGFKAICLGPHEVDTDAPDYGDLTLSTSADEVSYQEYWYRGEWFDNITVFWRDFTSPGPLKNRSYSDQRQGTGVVTYNSQDVCTLAATQKIEAGETRSFHFVITWNFPNAVNYWNPGTLSAGDPLPQWKNYYATLFKDSYATATYWWKNAERLTAETREFQAALFSSTLPAAVLDAVSANISILKTPTTLRLTDGTLYGFEGVHARAGCCEGSCTHVWNYEQVVPLLFPALARSMREAEFAFNQFPNGKMAFRMLLPPERTQQEKPTFSGGRAAADGQMGGVIKIYREWKISGNNEWLARLWARVKKSLEYAWAPSNEDGWDRDCDGVMEGAQHHTLDVEMYGPNSYITTQYHAALLAAAEMADAMGDKDAEKYRELYLNGRKWVEANLYNGQYFYQKVDLKDPRYPVDPELAEIKYQTGEGCHVDQVLGQWYAHLVGLGYILDPEKVRSAVQAVYANNFRVMRDHANANRIYALNDEKGIVICTWPRGGMPKVPVPYADECMNGFEYQIASHLIYEGFVDQGIEIVEAIRQRYDGERRNPWNEFECGSNYARSMASYGLLTALSGFEYDARRHHIGFTPRLPGETFRSFWSYSTGWGVFEQTLSTGISFEVKGGSLRVQSFSSGILVQKTAGTVAIDGTPVKFEQHGRTLAISDETILQAGSTLGIHWA